jgi:ATP-binding cassette subfamily F protein uup
MHYVSAEGLTKSYGAEPLFSSISFHISEGDKIGLIARNGIGKSTLLRILNGQEQPDEGKLFIHKDLTVAHFEQDPAFDEEGMVMDQLFHARHPIVQLIREYETAVEEGNEEALPALIDRMDTLQAWDFEVKVKQIVSRLEINFLRRPVKELSGGQRKRLALARTLIDIGFEHKHTLLMMDEPTNHLDVEMIEWLEHYLRQERVTLLLVTHDRYFLDAVTDEIWELEREHLYVYKGDYAHYMETKAARLESEQAGWEKARNLYRKELEWMRKQPRARTTKSKSRQDNFYELESQAAKKPVETNLQLQVKMSRLGGKVVEMKKVYKSFGDLSILKGFDYTFSKGERVGVIGRNGVGKSTFLQVLQQLVPTDSGKVNIGETVVFGHFSQQGLAFPENMRVIEYVRSIAENFPLASGGSLSAAQFLELFLFPPAKQFTMLTSLSGGEKKRLQLLTILFANPNFLILDEPTNDLDLPTLAVLENFLYEFAGCVLIVSHDRYFMDRLVDHLFVMEGGGMIRDFPGNYTQYRFWQQEEEKREQLNKEQVKKELEKKNSPGSFSAPLNGSGVPSVAKRKMSYKEKREWEQIEKELSRLNQEKEILLQKMSSGDLPFSELESVGIQMTRVQSNLDELELRWLELSELSPDS